MFYSVVCLRHFGITKRHARTASVVAVRLVSAMAHKISPAVRFDMLPDVSVIVSITLFDNVYNCMSGIDRC